MSLNLPSDKSFKVLVDYLPVVDSCFLQDLLQNQSYSIPLQILFSSVFSFPH